VKDEKGDLVTDSHSIVARWRNYFTQLFNVHGVKDVRQAEIHTAEPLVPEPSAAYNSVRREVLYKILIEFGIPRKLKVNKDESD